MCFQRKQIQESSRVVEQVTLDLYSEVPCSKLAMNPDIKISFSRAVQQNAGYATTASCILTYLTIHIHSWLFTDAASNEIILYIVGRQDGR
jgi:hypothetical protein